MQSVTPAFVDAAVKVGLRALLQLIACHQRGSEDTLRVAVDGNIYELSIRNITPVEQKTPHLNSLFACLAGLSVLFL